MKELLSDLLHIPLAAPRSRQHSARERCCRESRELPLQLQCLGSAFSCPWAAELQPLAENNGESGFGHFFPTQDSSVGSPYIRAPCWADRDFFRAVTPSALLLPNLSSFLSFHWSYKACIIISSFPYLLLFLSLLLFTDITPNVPPILPKLQ